MKLMKVNEENLMSVLVFVPPEGPNLHLLRQKSHIVHLNLQKLNFKCVFIKY